MEQHSWIEVGIWLATVLAGIAALRANISDLKERVHSLEGFRDKLPEAYVPRNEVERALASIERLAREARNLLFKFISGSPHPLASLSAAAELALEYSSAGMALTESFEELRLEAYVDCDGVLTIGWGHTGRDVHHGMVITRDEADALLRRDVSDAVSCVRRLAKVPLNQNQFDALVDFVFNEGAGRFAGSTLLHRLNTGDFDGAAAQFAVWIYGNGKKLEGLARRRATEIALFRKPSDAADDQVAHA